tara:strand:- start:7604 stop:8590 length:987 start_codon:yes stop_codon:yes gene_type:complete
MSNPNIIQAIPIPGKTLTSMTSVISGINDKTIEGYAPNGKYEIKTSSQYSDQTQGFNAFNDDTKDFWECDNIDNPNYQTVKTKYPQYTQKTYSGIIPSTYLGGGAEDNKNTWITKVGPSENKSDIEGEWIQIKLPYQIYLTSYSITTPTFSAYNTFPVKFTLVASNNDETWDYIDQQYINKDNLPSGNSPMKAFTVTTYNKYSQYRLIVTEMPNNTHKLRISTIKIMGTPVLNEVPSSEAFSTLYRSIDGFTNRYNKRNEKPLDCADFYRPTYSNYGVIKQNEQKEDNKKEPVFINKMKNTAEDVLLYTGIFTGVFISGIFIHNMIKR